MKWGTLWALPLFALANTASAQNGGGNSGRGGGYALVCYKTQKAHDEVLAAVRTVRTGDTVDLRLNHRDLALPPTVVDYREMLLSNGLEIEGNVRWQKPVRTTDFEGAFRAAYAQAWNEIYVPMQKTRWDFWNLFNRTRTGLASWGAVHFTVPIVEDATFEGSPRPRLASGETPHCLYMQVAYFNDDDLKVWVNWELYSWLDANNRMALWVHEDLTHYYRESRDQCRETVSRAQNKETGYRVPLLLPVPPVPERVGNWINWCREPDPRTTDAARAFAVHLLKKREGGWRDDPEFTRLATRISLSVEFDGPYYAGREPGTYFWHDLDQGDPSMLINWSWHTFLVQKFSRSRLARVDNGSSYWNSAEEFKRRGYEASFPLPPGYRRTPQDAPWSGPFDRGAPR